MTSNLVLDKITVDYFPARPYVIVKRDHRVLHLIPVSAIGISIQDAVQIAIAAIARGGYQLNCSPADLTYSTDETGYHLVLPVSL